MANCPNCGRTLRFTDWKQDCPDCGVNLIYYGSNERLLEESEQAEIEHAKHQPAIDRAKASFFGSWPAILRLILHVLPIGALFLPLLKGDRAMNVIDLYKNLPAGGFGALAGDALRGKPDALATLLLFSSAAMILVCLVCLVMSLGRHGKQRNLILNLIMIGAAAAAAVCWIAGGGRPAFGVWIYLLLLAGILVYNLYLAKKGLKVKWTACYIGGLPSEEYFGYVAQGMSDLEIRKKMVEALTSMQEEVREKERLAAQAEEERRKAMK